MYMCRIISYVVRRKCLLWPVCSLCKTLLAFALLHFVLQGQAFLLLHLSLDVLFLHSSPLWWKGHLFLLLSPKGLLVLPTPDNTTTWPLPSFVLDPLFIISSLIILFLLWSRPCHFVKYYIMTWLILLGICLIQHNVCSMRMKVFFVFTDAFQISDAVLGHAIDSK